MKLILSSGLRLLSECLGKAALSDWPKLQILYATNFHDLMMTLQSDSEISAALVELDLPGMYRFKGIQKLQQHYPALPLALISTVPSRMEAVTSFKSNIKVYIDGSCDLATFRKAIAALLTHTSFQQYDLSGHTDQIHADLKMKDAGKIIIDPDQADREVHLTGREYEVLKLLAKGLSNKEIARGLDLQEVTIKVHLTHVFRKLGSANRTQAVKKAMMLGIVPLS